MAKRGWGFTPGNPTGCRNTRFGEMTPREIRFCEEYVKDFNAAAAMRRCGFGEDASAKQTGYKYLKKQVVIDYIQKLMGRMSEQCETTVDDLMVFWTEVMNNPSESTNNRLKASDYLGKALGAFTVKVETQQAPTIIMDLGLPPAPPEPLALDAAVEIVMDEDDGDEDINEDDEGDDDDEDDDEEVDS